MTIAALLHVNWWCCWNGSHMGGQVCSEGFASSFRKIWKCDWLCCGMRPLARFEGSVHGWCLRCARLPITKSCCLPALSPVCDSSLSFGVYRENHSCASVDTQTHPLSWLTPSFPGCTSGTFTCARKIPVIGATGASISAATLLTNRKA